MSQPLFYGYLNDHPEWDMDAYALAVWDACPKTVSANQHADYTYLCLAEAFSIWALDTSEVKLAVSIRYLPRCSKAHYQP